MRAPAVSRATPGKRAVIFKNLIRKKRDGAALTQEEIEFFVRGLADASIPAEQVAALAMAVYFRSMSFPESGALTVAMANSGVRLRRSDDLRKRSRAHRRNARQARCRSGVSFHLAVNECSNATRTKAARACCFGTVILWLDVEESRQNVQ